MAAQRFFWLPWKLRGDLAAALGTTTRWAQCPFYYDYNYVFRNGRNAVRYGYNTPLGNVWSETLVNKAMPAFAVTQDPARVPLAQSVIDIGDRGNGLLDWPDEPSYRYWSGADSRVSVYHATTMNDPVPDMVFDERGPMEQFEFFHPAFFSAYELMGVSSINGGQFVCAGYQQYQQKFPTWLNLSAGASHTTYFTRTTTGYGPFQVCGFQNSSLLPFCAYVFRPSTGAIVGWLAWDRMGTMARGNIVCPTNPATLPTAIQKIESGEQGTYNWGSYQTVNGIQDHDLLVWEWWSFALGTAWMMNPDAQTTRPMVKSPYNHVRAHVGGGLAGQPLTRSAVDGKPNWAPAHLSEMTTLITGVEPEPLTWLTRAAPSGNGIELHFEDGTPEVTLTRARPSRGGIELTFGGAVQLAIPVDLGTPASGITVLGVTSLSDTVKQVDLARTGPAIDQPTSIVGMDAGESQDYGEDVSTYPDLDPNFVLQAGNRVIAETILRMLETPRGSLVYAPDRGYDVRALFGEAITQRTLAQAKRNIEAECLKDERVESVATALDFDAATSTLQIRLEVTTAAGPFRLTLAVTAVSLTILDGGK